MKKQSTSRSGFFNPRILVSLFFCAIGAFSMLLGFDGVAQGAGAKNKNAVRFQSVASYHNDRSAPARDLALLPARKFEHEDNENPKIPFHHKDAPDRVVQGKKVGTAQLGPVAPACQTPHHASLQRLSANTIMTVDGTRRVSGPIRQKQRLRYCVGACCD